MSNKSHAHNLVGTTVLIKSYLQSPRQTPSWLSLLSLIYKEFPDVKITKGSAMWC